MLRADYFEHPRYQEPVALPPQNAGRDTNGPIRETGTEAKSRAIPVDHRSDRARLRPGNPVARQVFGGKRAGPARMFQRGRPHPEVLRGEQSFRQEGNLKKEYVPTAAHLPPVAHEKAAHDRRMRYIENRKLGDPLRMRQSRAPRHRRAPIVSGQENLSFAQLVGDSDDIRDEFGKRIRADPARLAALVVTALVWDNHTKSGRRQRFQLAVPAIPKFRESMQQHD